MLPGLAAREWLSIVPGSRNDQPMAAVLQPRQILVAALAGWIGRQQDAVIDYPERKTVISNNNSVADGSD